MEDAKQGTHAIKLLTALPLVSSIFFIPFLCVSDLFFPPSSVAQIGYTTPHGITVVARRPALIDGYDTALRNIPDGRTLSPHCAQGVNDGSKGCFFELVPTLKPLLSDPDELHQYGILQNDEAMLNELGPQTVNMTLTNGNLAAWSDSEHTRFSSNRNM